MTDNLTMWYTLVQEFISETAFIEDGRVYIKELGIQEVPYLDPATVLQLMNYNPHHLENVYKDLFRGESISVEQSFVEAVYIQFVSEQQFNTPAFNTAIDAAAAGAVNELINMFKSMGFHVEASDDVLQQLAQATQPVQQDRKPGLIQSALFSALDK